MTSQAPAEFDQRERVQAPARLVTSVLKLVKACLLYDDGNQAVRQLVGPAVESIRTYCRLREAESARVLFAGDIVFVNRRVMRAGRDTVLLACELGEYLARCELTEVTFESHVGPAEVQGFARLLADGQRDPGVAARLREAPPNGIGVRNVEMAKDDWLPSIERSLFARVVRDYAASTLFMRRFYADLERGDLHVGNRVKRVAQKLVAIGDDAPQLCAALAAARFADGNTGRVVTSTAILACGMARMLDADRHTLANLAMAALMAEVGTARFPQGIPEDRLAASALVVLTAAGQVHPSTVSRSVIAHDALDGTVGAPAHCVLGNILQVARAFNRLRVPTKGKRAPGVDGAVAEMESRYGKGDARSYLQLLIGALGFFPVGSIVELDSGEIAAVTGVPKLAVDYRRPPVRLLCDASSNFLANPRDIDLAGTVRGEPPRTIRRALGTLDALRKRPS
jgi:hypothetical protein